MGNTIYSNEHKAMVKQLRKARIEAGLDQKTVAEMLNMSQSYISKAESGQRRIDIVQLRRFAKIYKKDIGYFI